VQVREAAQGGRAAQIRGREEAGGRGADRSIEHVFVHEGLRLSALVDEDLRVRPAHVDLHVEVDCARARRIDVPAAVAARSCRLT